MKEISLIRPSYRLFSAVALIALFVPALEAVAQQHVPPAPDNTTAEPSAPAPQQPDSSQAGQQPEAAPSAPAPSGPPVFPTPDPANFTASAPTKEVVNAFLQNNWGYDADRMWQVQAILKTPAEGVSKVVVLVGDKTGKQRSEERRVGKECVP